MNDHDLHALMFSVFSIGAIVILALFYSVLEQTKVVKTSIWADLRAYTRKNRRVWWIVAFYPAFFAVCAALWFMFRLVIPENMEIPMIALQAQLGVGAILLTLNRWLEHNKKGKQA